MNFISEKRFSDRKAFNYPIDYEVRDTALIRKTGICGDISSEGIGLATDHLLVSKGIVRLYIPVSMTDVAVPVYAEVMWSQFSGESYKAGLKFLA
jgi:PilZ domain